MRNNSEKHLTNLGEQESSWFFFSAVMFTVSTEGTLFG